MTTSEDLELLLEVALAPERLRSRAAAVALLAEKVAELIDCAMVVVRLVDSQDAALRPAAVYRRDALDRRTSR